MADIDISQTVKKAPTWVWLATGGGLLIGLWLVLRNQGGDAGGQTGGGIPGLSDAMGALGLQGTLDKVQTAIGDVTDNVKESVEGLGDSLQGFMEQRFGQLDDALANLGEAETARNQQLLATLNDKFAGANTQFSDLQSLIKAQFGAAGNQWTTTFNSLGQQLNTLQGGITNIRSGTDASNAAQSKYIIDALTNQLDAITRQITALQSAIGQAQGSSYTSVLAAASKFRDEFGGWGQEARYNWTLDEIVQKLRTNSALWAGRPERELLLSLPITHDYPMGPR